MLNSFNNYRAHNYIILACMAFPITVGKYELLQLLGEGNFAMVYKARHIQTKQIYAVKKMKKLNKQDVQMMKKEIEIMKDLKHKNIVEYITDFRGKQNGDWYIVLEYCGKGDMQKFKKKVGKIPEAHCKLFVRGILQALVELHKRKIAHRDLKLANILINDDYKLKLADFGFSKDYETGYMKSFCGTPLSMAPEILKRQTYNEKCDVWSLGVLTFMMLYNKPPFFPTKTEGMGIAGITIAVTLRNHKFDDSVQVSPICKKFIDDCLQKQASKRPSTKQLLQHEWFADLYANNLNNVSKLRENAIKTSIKQKEDPLKQQATKLCEYMLFGVFQHHLKKVSQVMLLNTDLISKLKQTFAQYYPTQTKILECYLLVVLKKVQELANKQVIYVLEDSSYKMQLKQLKKFKEFENEIAHCVENSMKENVIVPTTKINVQKEIVKFCLNETELLIDCMNDQQIRQKLFLLKTLCKFVTTDYQPTMIEIKWGERKDMIKYVNYIFEYFKGLDEQKITKVINDQPDSDEDLESTWLIQNHIRQNKVSKSLETELGKLALYVLNIPTNFSSDKLQQTQKIELDQESWLDWMKSYA